MSETEIRPDNPELQAALDAVAEVAASATAASEPTVSEPETVEAATAEPVADRSS